MRHHGPQVEPQRDRSVELKLQTLHVTHLYGNSELTCLNTANSQKYSPRYVMPGTLDLLAQNAPKQEMVRTTDESFTPADDVPDAKDPGSPTIATTQCLALMRKNGQNPTERTNAQGMESYCDGFYFLQAAVRARGSLLSNDIGSRGLEARDHPTLRHHVGHAPQLHAARRDLRPARPHLQLRRLQLLRLRQQEHLHPLVGRSATDSTPEVRRAIAASSRISSRICVIDVRSAWSLRRRCCTPIDSLAAKRRRRQERVQLLLRDAPVLVLQA